MTKKKKASKSEARHANPESVDMSDLISQTQAADLRGVTRSAIHRLIKRGKLRGVEVAGRMLVSRSEVERYDPEADKGGWPKGKPRKEN